MDITAITSRIPAIRPHTPPQTIEFPVDQSVTKADISDSEAKIGTIAPHGPVQLPLLSADTTVALTQVEGNTDVIRPVRNIPPGQIKPIGGTDKDDTSVPVKPGLIDDHSPPVIIDDTVPDPTVKQLPPRLTPHPGQPPVAADEPAEELDLPSGIDIDPSIKPVKTDPKAPPVLGPGESPPYVPPLVPVVQDPEPEPVLYDPAINGPIKQSPTVPTKHPPIITEPVGNPKIDPIVPHGPPVQIEDPVVPTKHAPIISPTIKPGLIAPHSPPVQTPLSSLSPANYYAKAMSLLTDRVNANATKLAAATTRQSVSISA